MLLALDPSLSSTGYAVFDNDKIFNKGRYQTTADQDTDTRILNITYFVKGLLYIYNVDVAILEDGFIGFSGKTSLQLAQLRGALINTLLSNSIKVIHQQPKLIRKNFGLSGNAKKEEVANRVLLLYPNLLNEIGPYSDKAGKNKTSDIYDAISIGLSYINKRDENVKSNG